MVPLTCILEILKGCGGDVGAMLVQCWCCFGNLQNLLISNLAPKIDVNFCVYVNLRF